jgi:DNA replication and repair protein RecF
MHVNRVSLTNFRNYDHCSIELEPRRNILIGENAQGKTNFLEALELVATGKSWRAAGELDLIKEGLDHMLVEVEFVSRGTTETIALGMRKAAPEKRRSVDKQVKINSLTQASTRGLRGRLVAVSFKSEDLNLLRGGPKYRRDWLDTILETLRPTFHDVITKYQKVILQRNRLLKTIAEQGRVSVSDQDQLKVWDMQLARFGSTIIKNRLELLAELLPEAEKYQEHISGRREKLDLRYVLSAEETQGQGSSGEADESAKQMLLPLNEIKHPNEEALAQALLRALKDKRAEEMARKQTTVGPHRDDVGFTLNGRSAVDFGSQGQQRSLVLALKLAELERITQMLGEPPLLLLDDVLAELDLGRQGLLMSLVGDRMQTVITTTHLDGFKPEWLVDALFLHVDNGSIRLSRQAAAV